MNEFDLLINEQLKTMESLLFIQSEIERYEEIRNQLCSLNKVMETTSIEKEINGMKQELVRLQRNFEQKTADVINCYQSELPINT